LDWTGVVVGAWRVPELLDDPVELLELLELLGVLDELAGVLDEALEGVLDGVVDDALLFDLSDDVPEIFTAACVDPGRTAITTPATTTLAKDTVTVVVFRRRRPCSRSATACASLREAA
jgi:hypothetical protein